MYYDFTGLPVIIENTQFCTIILLRSLGIQYDNIPRPGQYSRVLPLYTIWFAEKADI